MSELPPSADPLALYVVHLWSRKWWIGLMTAVAVAVAVLLLQFVVPEAYAASAYVFVKSGMFLSGITREVLSPVPYRALLRSDELLFDVYRQAAQANLTPPGRKLPRFDKFKNAFTVLTETEADTTVRRDYSPIIEMRLQWFTPEGAREIMDMWAKSFVRKYGNLLANEAARRIAAAQARYDKTMERIQALEAQRADIETRLEFRQRLLAAKENLLAPAMLLPPEQITSYYRQADRYYQSLNIGVPATSETSEQGPGLMTEATRLKIDIAAAEPSAATALERKLKATEAAVQNLEAEIEPLRAEAAELDKRRAVLAEDISAAKTQLQAYGENIAQVSLGLESESEAARSEYEGSDVRVVARPVTPDLRAFPKKRQTVIIVAAAALVFASLFYIAEKYLRDALGAPAAPRSAKAG